MDGNGYCFQRPGSTVIRITDPVLASVGACWHSPEDSTLTKSTLAAWSRNGTMLPGPGWRRILSSASLPGDRACYRYPPVCWITVIRFCWVILYFWGYPQATWFSFHSCSSHSIYYWLISYYFWFELDNNMNVIQCTNVSNPGIKKEFTLLISYHSSRDNLSETITIDLK